MALAADENLVRAEVADLSVAAGQTAPVEVSVIVPPGFHVFADRLAVDVVDDGDLTAGKPAFPEGLTKPDPLTGEPREIYEHDVQVDVPITVPTASTGDHQVQLKVEFQACKNNLCFLPKVEELAAWVHVLVPSAAAQAPPADEVAVIFTPGQPQAGKLVIHVDLQGEWHLNRMFMSASLAEPGSYSLGDPVLPAGEKTGSEADGTAREDFTHDFDMVVPVSGPSGPTTLAVDVGYQACKGVSLCRMPATERVTLPVVVGDASTTSPASPGASPPPATASPPPPPAATGAFAEAAAQGTVPLLIACFLAGILVSFTPCVLPMVPITMGLIGARGAGSRVLAMSLAGTYVLGQAAVYTALAVVAALTGNLFGGHMQNPWIVGGIAAFFVVMGAAMFGLFDLQVPSAIQSRVSGYSRRGGFVAALVFGAIGAVLAGPCSGPVVFAILGLIATHGQVAFGALLMFTFALGMGMIFLVSAGAMGWLPQRGAWMDLVKKSFGVVMWLGAIYFAGALIPSPYGALLTALVLLGTAVFAWPDPEDEEGFTLRRVRQSYAVIAGLAGAYLLLIFTAVQAGVLPGPGQVSAAAAGAAQPGIAWARTEAEAITRANAEGRLMMIDFTAEWCAACHEMEKYTYTDAAVVAEAGQFVPAMLDCTDKGDPVMTAVQKKYGVTGLPTVVFARADGTVVGMTVGFVKAEDFLAEMKKARAAAGS
jgi:thiol:disulfide interchange protein DsbD